jgi:phosphoribosylanthranilate isomerase
MTRIKICGNTEAAGVDRAVELEVDLLGFIFTRSPRRVGVDQARRLLERVPDSIGRVGVFIDEPAEEIARVLEACRLSAVQVYRPLTAEDRALPVQLIQAARMRDGRLEPAVEPEPGALLLVDTWSPDSDGGGSGRAWDWDVARELARRQRLLLSGGLRPQTVAQGIEALRPWGVDVASGVEAGPGIKDLELLDRFVSAVREADG